MNGKLCALASLGLSVVCLVALSSQAQAQPSMIPIQGMLTDDSGGAVDGVVTLEFRLYTTATGGSHFHLDTFTVDVFDGLFTAYIGVVPGNPVDLLEFFDSPNIWIGITVEGELEMSPRVQFGTTGYAAHANTAMVAGSVPWSGITGVPPEIFEGTEYSATLPLRLTGTTFGLETTGCSPGDSWIWTGSGWACERAAATGSCPANHYLSEITAGGTFVCTALAAQTAYAAGDGLSLTAGTFTINPAETQRRIVGTCSGGASIRAVNQDGSVVCEQNIEQITAADDSGDNLGSAIVVGGTAVSPTLAIDRTVVQQRVADTCPVGQYLRAITASGTVVCQPLPDATSYGTTAGSGLSLTGSDFAVDFDVTQRRVAGSCSAGHYMVAVGSNGTVTCLELPAGTTYGTLAGSGLTLSGTNFAADFGVAQRRVTESCPAGQYIRAITSLGGVECGVDADTNTTYSPGSGISFAGTTIHVDGSIQRRVTGTCPAGTAIASIGSDGSVACNSALTDVTVTPGVGLTRSVTGSSVNIGVEAGFYQRAISANCPAGHFVSSINSSGGVNCTAGNVGTITGVATAGGLTGGGSAGALSLSTDPNVLQRRHDRSCPAGQFIRGVDVNGTVDCQPDQDRNVHVEILTRGAYTMTTGGWVEFFGDGRFRWHGRIIMINNGVSDAIPAGHFNLNFPDGQFVHYPANAGAGYWAEWGAGGIPIPGWWGLWYQLPWGSGDVSSRPANFRVAPYHDATALDASWVLVAYRNGDTGHLFVNADGGIVLMPGQAYHPHLGNMWHLTTHFECQWSINAACPQGLVSTWTVPWALDHNHCCRVHW